MIDWKSHLAFEDATGLYPAMFNTDVDPKATTSVYCRVYGERFKPTFAAQWYSNLKFDEATGKCLSLAFPGKIINVAHDMLAGLDLDTGQPKKYTLDEAAAILGIDAPKTEELVKVYVTLEYASGLKDVLGGMEV